LFGSSREIFLLIQDAKTYCNLRIRSKQENCPSMGGGDGVTYQMKEKLSISSGRRSVTTIPWILQDEKYGTVILQYGKHTISY
jgi:hypothetical protein